ncbi:gamma-butyrobetaine hydroxylase-like domain-containing protein [Sulfurivirga sp.]|uniref:gamma-butyrobetaine hydroxylase-like domain-containing protein n=1 Tax=Sulfurivirga sp. TaxID=2614236 RepID=UPI0025D6D951|nr:gamma-butyrobetaine hydroxylase-like domain-containing protein [Sulfurivirga sp.]
MIPTRIELDRAAKKLTVAFDTGEVFEYTCEFLRVHSQSAEVVGHGPEDYVLQVGKENVGCDALTPVGSYGIKIHFDDGHDTGIYTWERLYELGRHYGHYWNEYLKQLKAAGHERKENR